MKLLKALKWFWYELGIMGLLIDDYGDVEGAKKRRMELYKKQYKLKKDATNQPKFRRPCHET